MPSILRDEDHPYGHGKAESLATAVVALMLLGAAVGIVVEAVREIRTPHGVPAPWTLGVLVAVVLVRGSCPGAPTPSAPRSAAPPWRRMRHIT
jgi:Co/Zn/Cd efflux system component